MPAMSMSPNLMPSANAAAQLVQQLKLQKALYTGDNVGYNPTPGSAYALKPQSLDKTLYNQTFTMADIQLFRMMPRFDVENSVNEHNELNSYSDNPYGGFFPEGGAPAQDSAQVTRRTSTIKYLGVARGATHQVSVQNLIDADAMTFETQAGTMDLIYKIERNLYHADSRLSPLQFDGFFAQIRDRSPTSNIIDMHGKPFTDEAIIDASTMVRSDPNYGSLTHIFCSVAVKGDIQRTFLPRTRILGMSTENDGILRTGIRGIETPAGDLDLVGTTLMQRTGTMPTRSLGPQLGIPAIPTVTNVNTNAVDYSNYQATDVGAYLMWVVAWNDLGCAPPVQIGSSAINVDVGGSITFDIQPGAGNDTKWFEVWKTPVNGPAGSQKMILQSPNCDANTGFAGVDKVTIVEYNDEIPGCERVLGLQLDQTVLRLNILAAMLRIPQPLAGTTIPFLLVSYMNPLLLSPRKVVMFKNVGRLPPQTVLA